MLSLYGWREPRPGEPTPAGMRGREENHSREKGTPFRRRMERDFFRFFLKPIRTAYDPIAIPSHRSRIVQEQKMSQSLCTFN